MHVQRQGTAAVMEFVESSGYPYANMAGALRCAALCQSCLLRLLAKPLLTHACRLLNGLPMRLCCGLAACLPACRSLAVCAWETYCWGWPAASSATATALTSSGACELRGRWLGSGGRMWLALAPFLLPLSVLPCSGSVPSALTRPLNEALCTSGTHHHQMCSI
jgi:hypothetical protein